MGSPPASFDPPPEATSPDTQPRATALPSADGALDRNPADGGAFSITLDLPFPPSTNRNTRYGRGGVHSSPEYKAWIKAAGLTVLANRQYPRHKITGPFRCKIELNRKRGRGDVDNRIKAVLDFLQHEDIQIIHNDRDCQYVSCAWVDYDDAPQGCRLTLWSIPS